MKLYKDAQGNAYGLSDESILAKPESIVVHNEKGEEFLLPVKESEKLKIECGKESCACAPACTPACAPPACAPACAPRTFASACQPPQWNVYSF
jgi:hypothetical protein